MMKEQIEELAKKLRAYCYDIELKSHDDCRRLADFIIDTLGYCKQSECEKCGEKAMKTIVNLQEALTKAKSEWISVEDRLPEDVYGIDKLPVDCILAAKVGGRMVIDWGSRGISFMLPSREKKAYWEILNDWDEGEGCEITHWMPLPEPPKMKGSAE